MLAVTIIQSGYKAEQSQNPPVTVSVFFLSRDYYIDFLYRTAQRLTRIVGNT